MVLFVMSAIAVLWIDFVREIRWCWEESEQLPRMKSSSSIDLSACLIHQKLQMVLVLISLKSLLSESFPRISSLCL
jgi:Rab3 GTPase-activating protein catalytic subunit